MDNNQANQPNPVVNTPAVLTPIGEALVPLITAQIRPYIGAVYRTPEMKTDALQVLDRKINVVAWEYFIKIGIRPLTDRLVTLVAEGKEGFKYVFSKWAQNMCVVSPEEEKGGKGSCEP